MLADADIWRAAQLLIRQHGEDAVFVAARRADDMIDNGDAVGEMIWKRICAAIQELQRGKPGNGESVN